MDKAFALLIALVARTAHGGTPGDGFLELYAETGRFLLGRPAHVRVTEDGKAVLFLRTPPRSRAQSLYELDVETGQTRELVSPDAVLAGTAQVLSAAEKARLERQRVSARGITSFELSRDGSHVALTVSGKLVLLERQSGKAAVVAVAEGVIDPRFSPDGGRIAYARDHDLFVWDITAKRERRLTQGGAPEITRGQSEFVAQEEMGRFEGFWWSPDSRWIAYEEVDNRGVDKLAIADALRPESGAVLFPYPRAGRPNAKVRLGVVSVTGGPTRWVQWDVERYPYLATVKWPKGGPLTVLVQTRAQQDEALLTVAADSGKTRVLFTEHDEAWLNLDQDFPLWLEDGTGFFWRTERNGAPEVELRDATGALVAPWVRPGAGFAHLSGYDHRSRTLYYVGGEDPTEQVLHRVREGRPPERMTTASAWQSAQVSRDGSLLVVVTTSLDAMPRVQLVRPDGSVAGELPSVAVEPPFQARVEIRRVGAEPGLFAALLRPRSFVPGKKLPVIVEVYGGPSGQEVTRARRSHLLSQWYADRGFLVVKIDGRGTPRRGRAFERSIRGDFATRALEDQVAALTALAAEVPEMDLARVGIQGWSFGGYLAALAGLRRPDVFRAAVAGAPVVDWRDYDTHYTERYLGLPHDSPGAYDVSSLLTYAPGLERPLLIVHGTADDNVYFFHSLKLSNALFRAGKHHELLALSGLTHMVPDPLVTQRLHERIATFFEGHLAARR